MTVDRADLHAAMRRIARREWTFGPEGPAELATNPPLAQLHAAGYIRPHFVSAAQQIAGRDDHYVLTAAGEQWLAANPQETP